MSADKADCLGLILAGGQARRMGGGDKCRQLLAGKSLLSYCLERTRPQVDKIILNINGDPRRFDDVDLPLVADSIEGYAGPLAGVLTGMEWAHANLPETKWILSIAADTPFFPEDLLSRLLAAAEESKARIAVAKSNGRLQPVFALWSTSLAADLRSALVVDGVRKIDRWMANYPMVEVEFSTAESDPFFNINSPEDLHKAEALVDLN